MEKSTEDEITPPEESLTPPSDPSEPEATSTGVVGSLAARAEAADAARAGITEKDAGVDVKRTQGEGTTNIDPGIKFALLRLAQQVRVPSGNIEREPTAEEVTKRATAYLKWMNDNG